MPLSQLTPKAARYWASREIKGTDIRRAAMDLLARREHAFSELVDKLNQKFNRYLLVQYSDDTHAADQAASYPSSDLSVQKLSKESLAQLILEQLETLRAENLQSDKRFIESFVNGRKSSGKGPLRIRQELKQKQVSDALVEQFLIDDDDSWLSLAEEIYHRKFGHGAAKNYQEKSRRYRFMMYRGFSSDQLKFIK